MGALLYQVHVLYGAVKFGTTRSTRNASLPMYFKKKINAMLYI